MLYRPALAREMPKPTARPPLHHEHLPNSFMPILPSSVSETSRQPTFSTHQSSLVNLLSLDTKSLDYGRRPASEPRPITRMLDVPDVNMATVEHEPEELHEIHYLITAGDMTNYYTSLLSWCPLSQKLALAVNEDAFWWDGEMGLEGFWYNARYSGITCLKCGGGFVLVAMDWGRVTIMDVLGCCKGEFYIDAGVTCAEWNNGYFYLGDGNGVIYGAQVKDEVKVAPLCHGFRQLVTGMFEFSSQTHLN